MKLSAYARRVGVTYKTAWKWWKAGQLDAYQLPTGTIIVCEPQTADSGVALYARVSSADPQDDVVRQMHRLRDYAAARGYQVVAEVTEMASGLNDGAPSSGRSSRTRVSACWSSSTKTGSRAWATATVPRAWSTRAPGGGAVSQ